MKSILFGTAVVSFALLAGCGSASRTPAQYAEDTQKAFAEQEAAMKSCYEGVLASKPDAKGDVTIKFFWNSVTGADVRYPAAGFGTFVGDESKAPGEVKVVNSSAPDEVVKCVTENASKARLRPQGDGAGDATWTFHFAPGAAPSAEPAPAS